MDTMNGMPLNLAIELYYEKHHALRNANLEKLIEIKKAHPEIFNKQKDDEIRNIIAYAKEFQKTERYQQLKNAAPQDTLDE